jgi:hypothetical protein
MFARVVLAGGIVAAMTAGGCGPTATKDSSGGFKGEQRLVANAIEDLQSAGQRHQASRICSELLAARLVRQIRRSGSKPCSQALKRSLRDVDTFELTVRRVMISGAAATATVVSGSRRDERRTDTLRLVKEGTPPRWKVASLGG